MSYAVELVRKQQQATSNWSGGTTTQIAIYPKDAVYSERNFKWRLSSAVVELEESVFTSLPGIHRLIMVLEGEMRLEHEGHHTVLLKPFDQDSFSGDWTTKSFGKVRDFNLMMAAGCTGQLTPFALEDKGSTTVTVTKPGSHKITSALYCVDGTLNVLIGDKTSYDLQTGDLLLLSGSDGTKDLSLTLTNSGGSSAHVIKADIKY